MDQYEYEAWVGEELDESLARDYDLDDSMEVTMGWD
ncbi:hypothetical protein SAMN05216482_0148 [Streptomyces sp. PAN_FS17]|nr:hypothetical protein SAMN05216482_0109 [Streptomyces sp. PAN_FS17]SEB60282.1 hypothetical protein SAMN05216482_0148 [Streptomyces sp. PAN_FS17]